MSGPSWRQLAAIPESVLKTQILRALDITPPPEGVSDTFLSSGIFAQRVDSGFVYQTRPPRRNIKTCGFETADDLRRAVNWPAGTPTGDAFRAWLRRWGWVPKNERPTVEPNDNTRMIT